MKSCKNCRYTDNMGRWPCDDCVSLDKWEEKPMTNADRIRAMSDEELARRIATKTACMGCIFSEECNRRAWHRRCEDVWLDWLKSPVKEDSDA